MFDNERGQALVEFALVVVIFVMLLSGLIDISRIAATWVVMTNATREGARLGALGYNDTEIIQSIENALGTLDTARVTIGIAPGAAGRARGVPLQVSVDYSIDLLMPVTAVLLPNPMPIRTSTVMRIE
ncbi:MAG TPA: pilus assembly protein [Firmicutes bacterium]|nr:pilus assembly protein [Bacillota bacterium]